jgi:hypothetical protein
VYLIFKKILYIKGLFKTLGLKLTSKKPLSSYILPKSSLNWFENKIAGGAKNQKEVKMTSF